jgi:hypothetical protein
MADFPEMALFPNAERILLKCLPNGEGSRCHVAFDRPQFSAILILFWCAKAFVLATERSSM